MGIAKLMGVRVLCLVLQVLCVVGRLTNVVEAPAGSIQGLIGEECQAFLGIPYAQAPLNSLRWVAPQPLSGWKGVFNATKLAHGCPQPAWEGEPQLQSEDCLYLNVYTPLSAKNTSGLPVMVYIHGGGWVTGSGMLPLYWGMNFANDNTGVILVTMNYRLGALGWLVNEAIGDQNFGFYDQQAALRWVQTNIAAFGGNPQLVTLAGQSAGGMSVLTHLTAPSSYGMFSQVIIQSGPPMLVFPDVQDRYTYSEQFSNAIGCADDDVSCLRGKSVHQILAAQNDVLPIPFPLPLDTEPSAVMMWMPAIDGSVILDTPQTLINQNKTAFVPAVWGTTRNETAGVMYDYLLPGVPLLEVEYDAIVAVLFGRENVSSVKEIYPARSSKQIRMQLSQLSADYIFTCSIRHTASAYANFGIPTYKYVFMHPPSTDPRCNGTVLHCADIQETCHGAELDYIFHTASYSNATFTSEEDSLSWDTLGYWTSFVNRTIDQTIWTPYNPQLDNNLALDTPSVYILNNWRASECDYWDTYGHY